MTVQLLIGYTTMALPEDELKDLMPEFESNKTLKDPEKIAADLANKRAKFFAEAKDMPYTGRLATIAVADPARKYKRFFKWEPNKAPPALAFAKFLHNHYEAELFTPRSAKADKSAGGYQPPFVVIGFNPRLFLKMLGIECSLPQYSGDESDECARLPLSLWYSNSDHRDIAEALIPAEFKLLNLETALKMRRPTDSTVAGSKWDAVVANWQGPGYNAEDDMWLVTTLAVQLGFFDALMKNKTEKTSTVASVEDA